MEHLKNIKASFRRQIKRPILDRFPSSASSKTTFQDTSKFLRFKKVVMPEQKMAILIIAIAVVFVVRTYLMKTDVVNLQTIIRSPLHFCIWRISYHFLGVHVAGKYDFHCHSTKQHWLRKYPNDWGCNKRIRSYQLFSQFLSLLCYQWRNSSIIDQKF